MLGSELIEIEYFTTTNYGNYITTVPNLEADKEFIHKLTKTADPFKEGSVVTDASTKEGQVMFVNNVEDSLQTIIGAEGSVGVFYDIKDHVGRPMKRLRAINKSLKYNYIVDVYSNLDVCLDISPVKRFILTHVPRKFSKIDMSNIVPKIQYRIKVWNTPVSFYRITMFTAKMKNLSYDSRVERLRRLVGYPNTYKLEEEKTYERIDFDVRRAMFNDFYNVQQEGFTQRRLKS